MEKPTRNRVDMMAASGMTIEEIADYFQCDRHQIVKVKSRGHNHYVSQNRKQPEEPVRPGELAAARRVQIGTMVTVRNFHKGEENQEVQERRRIVRKFPHIVLLDNGMSLSYAEIAMQMRKKGEWQ